MRLSFTFNGSYETFRQFAEVNEGAVLSGNIMKMESAEITGTVTRGEVEEGLVLFDWNLHIIKDHTFVNNFHPMDGDKFYLLTYYYDPAYDSIEYGNGGKQFYKSIEPSLLIMSGASDIEFNYRAGASIQCLSIAFTHSWLLQQLFDIREERLISSYLLRVLQSVIVRPLSKAEVVLATELSREFRTSSQALLVKGYIYNMLSFLYRQMSIKAYQGRTHSSYADVLIQVEKELVAHLSTTMPSLEVLAVKFYMSPSTLSRHFKATFGKGIHDYYINKKMELGRTLLQQGKSVSEAAFILGYESASHFIVMFKKVYGSSPGKIKREGEG